ncbi:Integral membrane protein OS=Streptomyces aurantiogriseus OX=66870 GN=GCM10010251_14920 PE=4 SV=1 [Streptomyces aurantiogriseus]
MPYDNPFAPPPEGTPDRPWQPRRPAPGDGSSGGGQDGGAPWGSQWSDRQPGRSPGGFGERPEGGGPGSPPPTPRWDPKDPAQRRARYALLCGMWAFFFALFGWPYVALLLGALALHWGISALRGKPRTPDPNTPPAPETGRPQTTAAISGLVTASLALALVAVTFTAQLVYRDYYTCTNDALTHEAKQSCSDLLPKELRGILGVNS